MLKGEKEERKGKQGPAGQRCVHGHIKHTDTDQQTDRPTDGRTHPHIQSRDKTGIEDIGLVSH